MQTNQEWQAPSECKVACVEIPSNLTSAESVATVGSNAYMTKDAEQNTLSKTPSNTHVTLAEAMSEMNDQDADGDNPDQQ